MAGKAPTDWIGNTQDATSRLSVEFANMLRATLGPADAAPFAPGDEMPTLWHWSAFLPMVPMDELARDGHPKHGSLLPPLPLERRMWAGGELTFHGPLHVEADITRRSTVANVVAKEGATGPMYIVTVTHEISQSGMLAVSERQDIVFLDIPEVFTPPRRVPPPEAPSFAVPQDLSEVLLFRYSAATFNAHRIHFDKAYASEVEKYPGLVVHGPMQAQMLMGAARAHSGRVPRHFAYRGMHPLFHFDDLRLVGVDTGPDTTDVCTATPTHQTLKGTITWGAGA